MNENVSSEIVFENSMFSVSKFVALQGMEFLQASVKETRICFFLCVKLPKTENRIKCDGRYVCDGQSLRRGRGKKFVFVGLCET